MNGYGLSRYPLAICRYCPCMLHQVRQCGQEKLQGSIVETRVIKGADENFFVTERFAVEHLDNFLIGSKKRISGALER